MPSVRILAALACLLAVVLAGCGRKPGAQAPAINAPESSRPPAAPPEIASGSEDGFHDLVFLIREHRRLPGGVHALHVSGTHRGRPVGLTIEIGPFKPAGALAKDLPLSIDTGAVVYRSTGAESDAFLRALDGVYGSGQNPKAMRKETRFSAVSLEGDPRDLAKGPVRIKLFHDTGRDADYAELFTNVDLAAQRLEIGEKDQEYRSAVVRALRAR